MISVCVPYWNRLKELKRMYAQYGLLYGHMNIELSVCDDGSDADQRATLVDVDGTYPVNSCITTLPQKDRPLNPCVPINRAVGASQGDIIVLTTPEVLHTTPVLASMVDILLQGSPDDYVTASCWDVGRKMWLAGAEVDYTKSGREPVPGGAHFHFLAAFHRSLWVKAGGFDEDYRDVQGCDDNDWLWRVAKAGAKFRQVQGVVYHYHSHTRWKLPHGRTLLREKWPEVYA